MRYHSMRRWAVCLIVLFLVSMSTHYQALSQKVTVQVAKANGVAPQGMIVTVKARLHKYGESVIIEESKTGWTDKEGKVTLVFSRHDKYYFDGEAVISCGSGVFSKEEKQRVYLSGTEPSIFFQRER
jgi:hypothetical protein